MTLYFGLKLDNLVHPQPYALQNETDEGIQFCGPRNLLTYLEQQLGIPQEETDIEYLRIEQFRQALSRYVSNHPDAYFAESFKADEFATAGFLLARRDELLLAGWDFEIEESTPNRLQVLAKIEQIFRNAPQPLAYGYADRFVHLLETIETCELPFDKVLLNEPFDIIPFHLQYLLGILQERSIPVEQISKEILEGTTDLARFKQELLSRDGKKEKLTPNADGSLILIKAKRETDAAAFLAKVFDLNDKFKPACIIPEQNRTLDNSIKQEGLPSMGILSASLARPTLQILKLVPTFLWKPIDPIKILEFVSLAVKPLNYELANVIAAVIAKSPGINSDRWNSEINRFFNDLTTRASTDKSIKVKDIRFQYKFWFERKRYDISSQVPTQDVILVFQYLTDWAKKQFDAGGKREHSLVTLSAQARKIKELLSLFPPSETHLTALQLERIVRTIYEPAPITIIEAQMGSLSYVHEPSAIVLPTPEVLWWNFHDSDEEHQFPKWYTVEMEYLENIGIKLETPKRETDRILWQRQRPFFQAEKQLILVVLERVDGSEVQPHPLFGDLQARFDDLSAITFDIHQQTNEKIMAGFKLPGEITLEGRQIKAQQPYLNIGKTDRLTERDKESFSSLDDLFYYPYKWVFKHKIKLHKSSILSVVPERTMFGNLAHRLFEMMFGQPDLLEWDRTKIFNFIEKNTHPLLEKEGSLLLMYGREPDKINFQNRVKFAAFNLVEIIRNNGWTIRGTEIQLEGNFLHVPIKGIADLVLERGEERAIVDFKWRNASYRAAQIKNKEDLQLVLYSKLLDKDDNWAHTSYYIIESGKMIARNNEAFKEAEAIAPNENHRDIHQEIWNKMENTYRWRMDQITAGNIEIRTSSTTEDLEEEMDDKMSTGELTDILEMKRADSMFNDYEILIS